MADDAVGSAVGISEGLDSLFSTPEVTAEASPSEDSVVEETVADPDVAEEPAEDAAEEPVADEEAEPAEEEPAAEEADPAKAAADPAKPADLPEGVKLVTDKKTGAQSWQIPADKAKEFHAAFELKGKAREILGDDLTPEVLEDRQQAADILDRMTTELYSCDKEQVDRLVGVFLRQSENGIKEGRAAGDPFEVFASSVLGHLDKARPELMGNLENNLLRSKLDGMYGAAKLSGDQNLFNAIKHLDKAAFGATKKWEQVEGKAMESRPRGTPPAGRETAAAPPADASAAVKEWNFQTKEGNDKAVSTGIDGKLKPYEDRFKNDPDAAGRIREAKIILRQEVIEGMKADKRWLDRNSILFRQASAASNPEVRKAIQAEINGRYAAKTKEILANKTPTVLSNMTKELVKASAEKHNQRQITQQNGKKLASATGARVPARIPDVPNMGAGREGFNKEMDALFNAASGRA